MTKMTNASKAFRTELFELMKKHGIEMEVQTEVVEWEGVDVTGVNFYSSTKFGPKGEVIREEIDVTVGTYEDFM